MNHILNITNFMRIAMFEKIASKTITIVVGILKTCIAVAPIILVFSGFSETAAGGLITIVFLLPALFLYYLFCVLNFARYICTMIYFAGVVAVELFFCACVILSYKQPVNDGSLDMSIFCFYSTLFVGVLIYLIQIIFRDQKYLKEFGHKDLSGGTNWDDIFTQISKQPKILFSCTARSYLVAAIIICTVILGQSILNFSVQNLIFIFYGLLFSLGLLPAILLYHSSRSLKLKKWICDTVYLVAICFVELCMFSFVFIEYMDVTKLPFANESDGLLRFGISIIALGGIVVYMSEVYFRNRAIIKSLQEKNISEGGK